MNDDAQTLLQRPTESQTVFLESGETRMHGATEIEIKTAVKATNHCIKHRGFFLFFSILCLLALVQGHFILVQELFNDI